MKWRGRQRSRNIEDRRRTPGRRTGRIGGKASGIGGVGLLAIVVVGYFLGVDVTPLLESELTTSSAPRQITEEDQQAAEFVSVVLADTETAWSEIFSRQIGREYRPPVLVLFAGNTQSPCGGANGATGPFYCPADRKAYLDTNFFVTLSRKFGAAGDFAAAYVVAHEVAHHVQNELGILPKANEARRGAGQAQANRISVMIELQADCFSGVWAKFAEARLGTLESGDIAEAMNAAKQIGDDTLQRSAGRRPMPHTFTHGTAEQRQRWFARGYRNGDISECDTFSTTRL